MKRNNSTDVPERMLDWIVDHAQVDELCARVRERERHRRRQRGMAVGGLAAAIVVFVTLFWAIPYAKDTKTVATTLAQRQQVTLKDGSQAVLNAQTTLFTDFRKDQRTVRLAKGEAYFSVVKDPTHPFLVMTPAGTVCVTGTEFNVRVTDGRTEVTLVEGRVAFEANGDTLHLQPGQQLDSSAHAVRALAPEAMDEVVAWKSGRAVFNGATLGEAMERFAAYHGTTIQVAPEVSGLRVGGSFALDDLPGFFSAIEEMLPAKMQRQPDGAMHVVPAAKR